MAEGALMDIATIVQVLESTLRLATPLLFACLAGPDFRTRRRVRYWAGRENAGRGVSCLQQSHMCREMSGSGVLAGVGASVGAGTGPWRGGDHVSREPINLGALPSIFWQLALRLSLPRTGFVRAGARLHYRVTRVCRKSSLPFAAALADVPVIGPIYSGILSGHALLVYVALLSVPATWYLLFRTRFGLRLRAVGENPAAVDTAGVSVVGLRFAAVAICGVLCGLAGAYLATGLSAGFVKDMTAGRGFIALAAMIFAKWRPWQAMGAVLLFGLLEAVANRFQNIDIFGVAVPVQAMQALPYILTVVILAGFVGKAIPPRAGGAAYVKEH
jgi:general nucleoside transport system permease protein